MSFVVLKFGGSVISPENPEYVKEAAALIRTVAKKAQVGIVVGGGMTANAYVEAGRQLGINEFKLDSIAISATRLNAFLLSNAIGPQLPAIPHTVEAAAELLNLGMPIVVMGGTVPGHTTNTVAALLAEDLDCKFVNVTNVDGVFDKDPKIAGARKFAKMSAEELVALATQFDKRNARENFVIDVVAAKIISRSNIETHVVNGANEKDVLAAVDGKAHGGTRIN